MGAQALEVERLRARARECKRESQQRRGEARALMERARQIEEDLHIKVRIVKPTQRAEAHSVPNSNEAPCA